MKGIVHILNILVNPRSVPDSTSKFGEGESSSEAFFQYIQQNLEDSFDNGKFAEDLAAEAERRAKEGRAERREEGKRERANVYICHSFCSDTLSELAPSFPT